MCDLLAFPENLGLCVAPCAVDADCTTTGDVCVTTGGRNVCRQPCTTGGAAFTLTLTPIGRQTSDSCGVMSINQTGAKTAGAGRCW